MVYEKPVNVSPKMAPTSLLSLLKDVEPPSLNKRVCLAYELSRCLMYLHSVSWLHKGLRSNNVVFFEPPNDTHSLTSSTLCGFDYARPDLPDQMAEATPTHPEHDLYRHQNALEQKESRSDRSYNIYSLGIILTEIAHWQPMSEILGLPRKKRIASS